MKRMLSYRESNRFRLAERALLREDCQITWLIVTACWTHPYLSIHICLLLLYILLICCTFFNQHANKLAIILLPECFSIKAKFILVFQFLFILEAFSCYWRVRKNSTAAWRINCYWWNGISVTCEFWYDSDLVWMLY